MSSNNPTGRVLSISLIAGATLLSAVLLSGCSAQRDDDAQDIAAPTTGPTPARTLTDSTATVPAGQQGWQTQLPRAESLPSVTEGSFVSQGAATVGKATLTKDAAGRVILRFSGFATGEGDSLQLNFNQGPLIRDSSGYYKVDDSDPEMSSVLVFGKPASSVTDQTFDVTDISFWLRSTQSITVYENTSRTAYGSVAIGPF